MAGITGHFFADFSDFYAAVQKAEVSLKGMETRAGTVSTSLNKMVDSFSGRKIVQDATLAAEAVQRIGGATALTATEQARLNVQVTEALAKYKALGQDAPKALTDLSTSLKQIEASSSKLKAPLDAAQASSASLFTTLKNAAGIVGIAFSVGAVTRFIGSVFDAASAIKDVSTKLGISAEAAQRFKFAAEQTGATMDDVGKAIGFMNKTLAEGDKSTIQALKAAGLSFQQIRSMKPEEAFRAITDAVQKIEDPMIQARIATELFSRGAQVLLPGIKEGFTKIGEAATVMSDETVESLEAAQDAWGRLADRVVIATGTIIAKTMSTVSHITSTWGQAAQFLENAIKFGPGMAAVMADTAAKAATMETAFDKAFNKKFAEQQAALNKTVYQTKGELAAAEKAAREYGTELKKLAEDSAQAVIKSYADLVKGIQEYARANLQAQQEVARTGLKVADFGKEIKLNTDALEVWFGVLGRGIPVVKDLGLKVNDFGKQVDIVIPKLVSKFEDLQKTYDGLANALGRLGQVFGGVFGAVLQQAGGVLTSLGDLADATEVYRLALDKAKKTGESTFKATAQYALQAAASVVSYVQTAIGIVEALYDDLSGKEFKAALSARGGTGEFITQLRLAGVGFQGFSDDASTFRSQLARFDEAVAASTARMDRYGLTWRDLRQDLRQVQIDQFTRVLITDFRALERQTGSTQAALKAMGPALSNLVIEAVKTGTKIPKALEGTIQQLIRMGGLTREAARAMLGLADDAMPALEDIREAAERYGLTLDDLGPKVQQLRIDETADQIVKDFQLLSLAGADVGVVMLAMKDKVQGLVTNALKLGLTLPESMRPLIKAMIDAGLLTDEFGGKLLDTSRLNFATPIIDKIDELIGKLTELIDHMSDVGTAAEREFGRARGAAEALGRAIPRGSVPPAAEPEAPSGTATPRPGSAAALAETAAASATALQPSVLANDTARGLTDVTGAAERLGLNLDAIGESIRQLTFTDLASSVANDLDILSRAGADMDAVLEADGRALADVAGATERLGLNIDAIGQSIQQMGFTEAATAVAKDLDIVAQAGADMDAALTRSRDRIQTLVNDAQRFGFSLPESIKPFLQQMVNAGKLTDLFGDQLGDLGDLHFTEPLERSVDELVTAMRALVGVITDEVGGALDDLGRKIVRPRVIPDVEGVSSLPPLAPTLASEATVAQRAAGGTDSAGTTTVILEADGRALAEVTVPHIPGVVQRYGLA